MEAMAGEEGVSGYGRPSMGCSPSPSGRLRWRPSRAHEAGLIPYAPGQVDGARRSKASNGPSGNRVDGTGTWSWSWPPLGPHVPLGQLPSLQGGHGRCPPPGSSTGYKGGGAQSLQAKAGTPIPMGHSPPPRFGGWSIRLSTVPPNSAQSSPGSVSLWAEGSGSAHTRGPQGQRCWDRAPGHPGSQCRDCY